MVLGCPLSLKNTGEPISDGTQSLATLFEAHDPNVIKSVLCATSNPEFDQEAVDGVGIHVCYAGHDRFVVRLDGITQI